MSLITKEINIDVTRTWRYYENLGYEIPKIEKQLYRKKDGRKSGKRITVPRGTKIVINPNDLSDGSTYKVTIKCDCCGEEKSVTWQTYKLVVDEYGKTYCRKCYSQYRISGFLNPNWNPNLSNDERQRNYRCYDEEYIEFIKKVYKRDNYKCQICESKNNIQAHHLYSWNDNVLLRKDLNNAITLCEDCHKNFHLKYKYGNNTKDQFINWLNCDLNLDYISILSNCKSA